MANAIYYEMQEPRSSVKTLLEEPWSLRIYIIILVIKATALETIGNGWKSIFSRMQNVKASKQFDDYGESMEYRIIYGTGVA